MARKNTARIVNAFLLHAFASDVRLVSDGTVLRSYALTVAVWEHDMVHVFPASERAKCSATTRSHIDAVRELARVAGIPIVSDLAPPLGAYLGPKRGSNAPRLS